MHVNGLQRLTSLCSLQRENLRDAVANLERYLVEIQRKAESNISLISARASELGGWEDGKVIFAAPGLMWNHGVCYLIVICPLFVPLS